MGNNAPIDHVYQAFLASKQTAYDHQEHKRWNNFVTLYKFRPEIRQKLGLFYWRLWLLLTALCFLGASATIRNITCLDLLDSFIYEFHSQAYSTPFLVRIVLVLVIDDILISSGSQASPSCLTRSKTNSMMWERLSTRLLASCNFSSSLILFFAVIADFWAPLATTSATAWAPLSSADRKSVV